MTLQAAPCPLKISTVILIVHDLDSMRRFYGGVVGLHEVQTTDAMVRLGAGGRPLLELRQDRHAGRRSPRDAGLFHTAFLLPARDDLGRWAIHAARNRAPLQGAADHAVSEAIYLSDPEGNGVEIYWDRPRAEWTWSAGTVALTTDPLDTDALMRDGGSAPWHGAPAGTAIGHVHLQVGAIAPAEAFYAGVLGLPVTARYPGGTFYGIGGYHHHFATNIWNSRGSGPRGEPATGLSEVRLTTDQALLDGVRARAGHFGLDIDGEGSCLTLRDPWGTALTLTSTEA